MIADQIRGLVECLETPAARRVARILFIALALAFTLVPVVRFLRSGTDMDYRTWYDVAQTVLQHREIYPRSSPFPFMYPPTCAVFLTIVGVFGKPMMILILSLLNTVAWVLCINFSLALATREKDSFRASIALISNAAVIVFIWSSYHLGQPSLLLLALMLGAFLCLQRDRPIWSGALIATAAAIKAFPFLAICYLLYRRYWSAALSLVVVLAVLLFALPIPFRGVAETITDFRTWERGMLRYQQTGIAQRPARGYSWKNQSVFGLSNRLLRHVSAEDEGKPAIYANVAELGFGGVNAVIAILALVFGISFVAVMPWTRSECTDELEFAALLILILIFTPLAFGYLFSWLMLPLAVLTRAILYRENVGVAMSCLLTAILLLAITAIAPRTAQIYGSLFLAAVALYGGIAIELWRVKRAPDSVVR